MTSSGEICCCETGRSTLQTTPKPLSAACALGASADLVHRILATMFGVASGHKRIFALTALITFMSYFRLLDDLRLFRMITLRRCDQVMPHSSILPVQRPT